MTAEKLSLQEQLGKTKLEEKQLEFVDKMEANTKLLKSRLELQAIKTMERDNLDQVTAEMDLIYQRRVNALEREVRIGGGS